MWVILLVLGIIALYVGYQYYTLLKTPGALKAYQSTVTMQIGLQANANSTDQYYSDYVTTSEALADTLVTSPILSSPEFATQVSHQIQVDTDQINQRYPGANLGDWQNSAIVGSAIVATRTHSLVTVSVTWSTPAGAWAIANAVGEVSASQINNYLDYEVRSNSSGSQNPHPLASAKVISAASLSALVPGPSANRPTLLLTLLVVALVLGIALALLMEYLDDRIWSKEAAVQALQVPVFGEVPRAPSIGKSGRVG